jgi:predicted kinase
MAWGMLTSEGQARAYLYENRGRAGGEFYLTVGLPASGKTQWIADHLDARVVSMDRRRAGRSRRDNPRVFHEAWEELKQALHHRERVVWDATNITEEKRQRLISLARDQHAFITLIYLDTPLPVALARTRQRDEVVPEKVIRRYAEELEPPRPWEYDELVWGEE